MTLNERMEMQRLAAESADKHFNEKHEGDFYAHYYGFIYGYQKCRELRLKKAVEDTFKIMEKYISTYEGDIYKMQEELKSLHKI